MNVWSKDYEIFIIIFIRKHIHILQSIPSALTYRDSRSFHDIEVQTIAISPSSRVGKTFSFLIS